MNRRIRKKKGRREFDFKGFEVDFTFPRSISADESDEYVNSFCEFADSINLGIGGGGNDTQMGFFVVKYQPCHRKRNGRMHYKHVSCSGVDQESIKKWIEEKIPGTIVTIGPLVGCNSGK